MNDQSVVTKAQALGPRRLDELQRVRLIEPVSTPAGMLAAGSAGTIVAVWGSGEGYDVEFTQPFVALVTLRRSQLRTMAV